MVAVPEECIVNPVPSIIRCSAMPMTNTPDRLQCSIMPCGALPLACGNRVSEERNVRDLTPVRGCLSVSDAAAGLD